MKRFINPSIDELNAAYRAAKTSKKVLIEKIVRKPYWERYMDDVKQYDGFTDSDQIIYLVSKKELACWKHVEYEVILNAAA